MIMSAAPPRLPPRTFQPHSSGVNSAQVVLIVFMWLGWLGVIAVADFLAFMMFAFADSPKSADAAKLMIIPTFIWFGVTFVVGAVLLFFRKWWTIVPAFVLAISPPFMVFLGYNLLSGVSTTTVNVNTPPAPPPVVLNNWKYTPPPPTTVPTQPDFQKYIREAQRAATQPGGH